MPRPVTAIQRGRAASDESKGFESTSRFESNLTPFDSLIPTYFQGHILNSIDT